MCGKIAPQGDDDGWGRHKTSHDHITDDFGSHAGVGWVSRRVGEGKRTPRR